MNGKEKKDAANAKSTASTTIEKGKTTETITQAKKNLQGFDVSGNLQGKEKSFKFVQRGERNKPHE